MTVIVSAGQRLRKSGVALRLPVAFIGGSQNCPLPLKKCCYILTPAQGKIETSKWRQ